MKKRAFTLAELGLIFFIMAILAVIFYKTLRPERIVYTHLYYSAYEQLLDAYAEVKAYYIAPRSDGANFLGEDTVYNFVHPNNEGMIRFLRSKGYTVLNMLEIRKPYKGEKLTTQIAVDQEIFDF